MTLKTRIGASVATVALLSSLFAQAAFAADLTISDNGKKSVNKIEVTSNCSTTVVQANETEIVNNIVSVANSGGNKANDNGGDVSINTGTATSNVTITNNGSSNEATLNPCCCQEQSEGLTADISGNLKKSWNTIKNTSTHTSSAVQANSTGILNSVYSKAKSGKNKANDNIGGSSVGITTQNAGSTVGLTNSAPSNTLNQ